MIAYCGLNCDTCPIYLASIEQDLTIKQSLKESVAKGIADIYGVIFQPENIPDCDGCRAITGRLFYGCNSCKIRKCALENNFFSCAECPEYACEKLLEFLKQNPSAKTSLETIRKNIK